VRFAVTEPLDLPPVVTLHSEERPSLPLAEAGEDEYAYTYSPTGAEPQESVALTATLVDGSGNLAEDAAVGHVTFDFQPPPVTGIRAEDGSRFLRGGATGFVRLTVSETLSEAPRVVLDEEGVDLEVQADSAPPVYRYAYTVGPGDEPGPHGVTAFATDEAGNRARVSAADVLVFDFAPPAFREPPALVNPVARPGVVLGVEFELDEALGRLPDVELVPRGGGDPIPLAGGQQVGHRYAYAHEAAAEEEGDYRLAIHGHRDRADNPADPWTSDGLVVVDATKPRVTTGPTLNKTPSYYRATEHVEVFFTVSEDLGGREPVASLGTEPELQLEGCGVGRDGLVVCRLARALSGQERPEGPVGLLIELQDAAGNLALERAPLTLDFTYPRASADVVPRFANADSIVQVTVTVSEVMAYGYPILEHRLLPDGLWLRFADPEDRGLGYVCTRRAADGLESGRWCRARHRPGGRGTSSSSTRCGGGSSSQEVSATRRAGGAGPPRSGSGRESAGGT